MENFLKFDDFVILLEANRNYPLMSFQYDMRKLGWEYEDDHANGQQFVKWITRTQTDGKREKIAAVAHSHDKIIDAGTLNELPALFMKEYILTGDRSFIDSAPWDRWGLTSKKPKIDIVPEIEEETVSEEEMSSIAWANNRYNKVELEPLENYIYNAESGICIMKKTENRKVKYNTCRSETDRRPLNKTWFDLFDGGYEQSPTGYVFVTVLKQKKRDKNPYSFELFPIMKDGTVAKSFKESNESTFKNDINE